MSVKDKTEQAKASVEKAYASARENVGNAYDSARTRAVNAYDSARTGVRSGARRTGEGIEESPLLALGIGAILGLVAGALIPRSEREKRALSNVGGKINDRAHQAYGAAKDAGVQTLKDRGITAEAGESMLREVVKGVGAAARQSVDAGTQAVKSK